MAASLCNESVWGMAGVMMGACHRCTWSETTGPPAPPESDVQGVNTKSCLGVSTCKTFWFFCIGPVIMTHKTPWLLSHSPAVTNFTPRYVHPPPCCSNLQTWASSPEPDSGRHRPNQTLRGAAARTVPNQTPRGADARIVPKRPGRRCPGCSRARCP